MKKYLQSRIAHSKLALPAMATYAVLLWLLCGLVQQGWWLQFGCFAVTVWLIVLLNNTHVLIRIFSRMVSCAFLALMGCACFLFPSLQGAVMQMFVVAAVTILFMTYQDKQSAGITYYAWVMFGFASLTFVHIIFFMPLLWLLTAVLLQSLSWRTWMASLIGLATPYWFWAVWELWTWDFTDFADHFAALASVEAPFVLGPWSIGQKLVVAFIAILYVTGTIHFLRKHHEDKIRIRMFYLTFIWLTLATLLFLMLQPQHYDNLVRLLIISTSPLIGHFLALTTTKITNIAFFAIVAAAFMLTIYNVWMFLLPS